MITRRTALGAGLAAAAFPLREALAAYPERPIRWIVGYAAGGGTDILARLIAANISARLGQPIVIENRPGAGNGGGQQILHTRANLAIHPAGFSFTDANVALESPSLAELALASNWTRVAERKNVPLAFLRHG